MSITPENQSDLSDDWNQLIEDCINIVRKQVKKSNIELLNGKYLLGKCIMEYDFTAGGKTQQDLADALETKQQRISEAISTAKLIDKEFGNFDGFLEYFKQYDEIPSWNEFKNDYLPYDEIPKLDENRLVNREYPVEDFESEAAFRAWLEQYDGEYLGTYFKAKIPKDSG